MNILNKLSIRNLKLNKKRTISTFIGIMLSVALICAVSCMVDSFKATLVQNAINEYGYYHIKLSDVSDSNMNKIKNNRDIKDIQETTRVGYAKLDGCQNKDKPYVELYSMSNSVFENLKFNLIEGRFANNCNELVISKHISTNGKVNLKVGDEITLSLGKRMIAEYELDSRNPYNSYYKTNVVYKDRVDIEENERLDVSKIKTFKIVGIIERPVGLFEDFSSPGYTVITTNMNEGHKDLYLSLKNPLEYKTSIAELLGASDYDKIWKEDVKYDFNINLELLRWEAFAFSDSTVSMLYGVVGVVLFIIIFTSVFCIRNSFAISTTEKMKMYGMLSSVGATRKQIKKNVVFEGFILGIIGIPTRNSIWYICCNFIATNCKYINW